MRALGAILTLVALSGCSYRFGGNVHTTGRLDHRFGMTSFGGNIDVDDAPKGAHLRSFGGNVRIGASSGSVVATSYGGAIAIESLESDASLRSFGGSVDVQLADESPLDGRNVSITAYGGDVTLRVPRDFAGSIDVRVRMRPSRADDYEIESDFPLAETTRGVRGASTLFRPRAERRMIGHIGEGRDRIFVRTEEGNVRLVAS